MIEDGTPKRPEARLSDRAEAVQTRMFQTVKDLRRTSLGTPELLVAMLDEPVVVDAFRDVDVPRDSVIAAFEWTFGQMTGVAPESPPPARPRFSFFRRRQNQAVTAPKEPYITPVLADVMRLAARDVQRAGDDEVTPADWFVTMLKYEKGSVHSLLSEGLKIDKESLIEAINRRAALEEPMAEARRILGIGDEPLDDEIIASLTPTPPFPAYQDAPPGVYEEETWGIERFRQTTSKWNPGSQAITAQIIMLKGEQRLQSGRQLLAMELLPDNGGWLTDALIRMSKLSDQALARMVLSMDFPPQPQSSQQ